MAAKEASTAGRLAWPGKGPNGRCGGGVGMTKGPKRCFGPFGVTRLWYFLRAHSSPAFAASRARHSGESGNRNNSELLRSGSPRPAAPAFGVVFGDGVPARAGLMLLSTSLGGTPVSDAVPMTSTIRTYDMRIEWGRRSLQVQHVAMRDLHHVSRKRQCSGGA